MRRATQPGALVAKALRKQEKARLRAFFAKGAGKAVSSEGKGGTTGGEPLWAAGFT